MSPEVSSNARVEIEVEIEKVLRETEASTLSLGRNLGQVLCEAQQLIAEMKARVGSLGAQGDASVTTVLDRQCRTVAEFVQLLSTTVSAQGQVAERVLETSRTVAKAAQAVEAISMQSRMLSLNTMIEAERLGAQGRPVMVIAREMRELSDNIADSNQEITRLATELTPLLADVQKNISVLRAHTGDFETRFDSEREKIGAATAQLERTVHETLGAGDLRLESVVKLTNDSLVDLQCQDIVSQRLRRVIRLNAGENVASGSKELLGNARRDGPTAAELIAAGDATDRFLSESLQRSASATDAPLDSGEMLLF
jgi:uncharacterized protein YukE